MQQSKLGNTDLWVSRISLGTMSLKGGASTLNTRIIQEAYHQGINYFDTADLYERGMNEDMLGQVLLPVRHKVLLATKVGNQWNSDGQSWSWKASKAYLIKNVEASLSRLKTDYIDLYQLHGGLIEDPIDDIIEAFELLKKQGKIRYYGLSSIRPNVIKAYAERSAISSVMMPYSLLDRRAEDMFSLLREKGIAIIARGALAQGLLLDKPAENYLQLRSSEVLHARKQVDRLAELLQVDAMTVVLSYVLSDPLVATAALGLRTMAQLDALQPAISQLRSLTAAERTALELGLRKLSYTDHLL